MSLQGMLVLCEDLGLIEDLLDLPFFILLMRSLLNRPLVFSCRGQLMVTISH